MLGTPSGTPNGPPVAAPWMTSLPRPARSVPALLAGLCLHAAAAEPMTLTSPSFVAGATLPARHVYQGYGCKGGNVSPALQWRGIPAGTRSLAVTLHDPDAPGNGGWWHWVVYNLPPTTTQLPEGAGSADGRRLPAGSAQGTTDFGSAGFGGACPPEGDPPHRYRLTLHALDTARLPVAADAPPAAIGAMIQRHQLASTTVEARYGR